MKTTGALIVWALVCGLVAGVLLDMVTFLVARYGPQFGHWSFRGNGALAVPFGFGPAILAGAWVALVLRYRGFPGWLRRGLITLLIGAAFLVLSVFFLYLTDVDVMLLIVGWMIVAPVVAGFIRRPAQATPSGAAGGHIGAGVGFPVAMALAFYASGSVLAPGS